MIFLFWGSSLAHLEPKFFRKKFAHFSRPAETDPYEYVFLAFAKQTQAEV